MIDKNYVVRNPHWDAATERNLFGDDAIEYVAEFSLISAVVDAGIFSSRGQAKKSGLSDDRILGFGDRRIGKRSVRIAWWIPICLSPCPCGAT